MSQTTARKSDRISSDDRMQLDPGFYLGLWQRSATCGLRANERLWCGIIAVAQSQSELGHELLDRGLLKPLPIQNMEDSQRPADFVKAQLEQHVQRVERIASNVRKCTGELTECFVEATQLLLDDTATVLKDNAAAVADNTAVTQSKAEKLSKTVIR